MFYWRRDPYADTWVLRTLTKLSKFLIVYWEKWSSPRQFSWKDHVHFILFWSMIWASMHTMWLMYFEHVWSIGVAPMVSLRGKRETRVNGNDSQGPMGRPVISFPPSIARKFSSRERYLGTRQGQHHSQTKITRKLFALCFLKIFGRHTKRRTKFSHENLPRLHTQFINTEIWSFTYNLETSFFIIHRYLTK